ncbi:hypothetical protein ABZ135_37380 [Streptomyces sp. NPDC006339]|uniref:hypothetical protein n=1 Tax=Streptomyces sp. NPDC006339 TaxID=3156755 RepID=UPI0033BCAF72
MKQHITHFYFGPSRQTRSEHPITETGAYELIGANTVGGFEPDVFTHDAAGCPLTTPEGAPLLVVTLSGVFGVVSALAFVREGR